LQLKKKITIIPNVENVFRKIEKFLDYVSEKRSFFIQNTEDFLAQLDKQFGKAELLLNYHRKSNAFTGTIILKSIEFIKELLDFAVVEWGSKPILEPPKI
jgi:transcription-repair coupling factor (superfamily II helicase)